MSIIKITELDIKQKDDSCLLIDKLSLSINRGEVLAIIGTSGSGKSVLINAMMKSLSADFITEGELHIDPTIKIALIPQSSDALNPTAKIGAQLTQLDPMKKWYQRKNQSTINSALNWAQLPISVANLYPYQLSGGMAKRALSALAFIQNPDVIIADEPSCGLNNEYAQSLFQHYKFLAQRENKSVIIISHDLKHVIDIADRILVLNSHYENKKPTIEHTTPDAIKQGMSQSYSQALWKALPSYWNENDSIT